MMSFRKISSRLSPGACRALRRFRGLARAPRAGRSQRQGDDHLHPRRRHAHQRLTLPLDKAAVVQLDADARDVLVSNPDLVDAVVRTPRRIFLLATKVGQTNAFFFDAQGKQILALDIRVEKDVVDLAGLMKAAMPNSAIQVQAMNDNVVLTGSVASALEAQPRRRSGGPLHRRSQEGRQYDRHRRRPAGDAESPHRRNEPQCRQAVRRQSGRPPRSWAVPPRLPSPPPIRSI